MTDEEHPHEYIFPLTDESGQYSLGGAYEQLCRSGYRHARDLLERGAVPVAKTIDAHFLLDVNGETWVIDASRSGGGVERLFLEWQEAVRSIENNEDVSKLIGFDEDED